MAAQLQALLRFLSQDAKVPLASAMGKIKDLQEAGLQSAEAISRSNLDTLQSIFKDGKVAKQVFNAAKRVTKKGAQKRGASALDDNSSSTKKAKLLNDHVEGVDRTPYEIESILFLPLTSEPEETLSKTILRTNRAPLVLAFAVAVLKYTMPEQPMSSRLSLSQAVVSANSRSKAVSLGIESAVTAADEQSLGEGQPKVRVLGREVPVLKRWDYDPCEGGPERRQDGDAEEKEGAGLPPLWGLDLEAAKRQDNMNLSRAQKQTMSSLPVHTPESARSYLLKSFTPLKEKENGNTETSKSPKKKKSTDSPAEKERCLGLLLQALDILFSSWSSTLSAEELDRRAWGWYVRVRPEIQAGVAGWGEKGILKLADILSLKR